MKPVEVKVPVISDVNYEIQVFEWLYADGDVVKQDDPLVGLETDKASLEIPAPVAGKLLKILAKVGQVVEPNETIAIIEVSA